MRVSPNHHSARRAVQPQAMAGLTKFVRAAAEGKRDALERYSGDINGEDKWQWRKTSSVELGFETLRVIYCCEKDLSYCDAVLAYLLCPLCCPTYFACGCICPDPAINAANPQKGFTALDRAVAGDHKDAVRYLLARPGIKPKQECMKMTPLKRAVESKSDDPYILRLLAETQVYSPEDLFNAHKLAQEKKKAAKALYLQEALRRASVPTGAPAGAGAGAGAGGSASTAARK